MSESPSSLSKNESLSALVDNEVTDLELRRLLKESQGDDEIKQRWQRYQLIGSAIREDLPDVRYSDLSQSISAAIADEPELSVDLTDEIKPIGVVSKVGALWSSLGRVAVAASVAGAVVIGVQTYQSPVAVGSAGVVAAVEPASSSPSGLPIGYGAPAVMARTVSSPAGYNSPVPERQVQFVPRQGKPVEHNPELQAYLNHLMLEHAEHAALNGSRGMMPFARVAEFETRERFDSAVEAVPETAK